REHGLDEHPGIEIGPEAMDEYDRGALTGAEIQYAQAAATSPDFTRRRSGVFRGGFTGGFGCDETGDKSVDLGIGHAVRRRHRKQRADRQSRAGLRDDAAQRAAVRGLENVRDLRGFDFEEFFARLEAVAL